ncbi:ABC transporter ATP-binding protein [Dictyobacter arantiisoli]|uniref:ABC-type quaternary amine transporter n=1 Tax=Dictyobacter arantiisoli TaxID=2014874 RepID=A0A5A5T5N8_9CHLR|nr:ABC transporter ATP-binding protein [Dictyobacter arantiisoli]GCF06525.1 ABC transporter ATP-binding protein [Dictyobacter arantiisoli]
MLDVALCVHFDTFQLNIAFTAQTGQTTILLGESGAGKSTVLRLLAGLQLPEQGHIILDNVPYYDSTRHIVIPPQARPFGYVFQDYVLFPHLTVFENIAFGLRAQHLPRSIIRQRTGEALERVRLGELASRLPAQLSGGQQQRVAIARALALRPQLLLLDEPLAALDVQTRREVRQELRQLLREIAVTTLFVTHHYLDGLLFGDQILVMDHGQLIQQGAQRELREYPRSTYIAELVGVNFLRGRIIHYENPTTCIIQLPHGATGGASTTVVATLKDRAEMGTALPEREQEVFVVIDPRSITLHQTPPEGSARNIFQGSIIHILQVGTSNGSHEGIVRVSIQLQQSDAPLTAEITEASALRMGLSEQQTIYATFKASEANAYL